jgi:hypothetical protein
MLSAPAQDEFGKALSDVIGGIVKRAEAERQKSAPWKDLYTASEDGLYPLLSEANHQTSSIILGLSDIIQEKFGLKRTSHKLYDLLKALPFAMNKVRDEIEQSQGRGSCADKARQVYYEEVLEEIRRIQQEEKQQ